MNGNVERRKNTLRAAGASQDEAKQLLEYAQNRFDIPPVLPLLPLPDEPFVSAWEFYAGDSASGGIESLRLKLVQLAFPVEAGMSGNAEYLAATRRGIFPQAAVRGGALLSRPEDCRVNLHDSYAGRIGVVSAEDRADFETLVRVFTGKNEPTCVHSSMGATMVGGYNNWHRISLIKERFLSAGGTEQGWPAEFQRIKAERELYQDRFIILSKGPYSGVRADSLGFTDEEWITRSRVIRLEHECAHYFTRRVFGSMQNNLLDEMIADYVGLRSAFGCFRAEWMLQFLGLESYPGYREGGRLQNYRGDPRLSDGAFQVLTKLVWQAAWNLEDFDRAIGPNCFIPRVLMCIGAMTIDELAEGGVAALLSSNYGNTGLADNDRRFATVGR